MRSAARRRDLLSVRWNSFAALLASAYYTLQGLVNLCLHATIRTMSEHLRPLISAEQIRERVTEMARAVDADSETGPLYMVSVLKGSFIFVADLGRAIQHPVRIEFMAISTYGKDKTSSGQVKLLKDLDVSIEGQQVLVVEDIVDSGVTLNYLLRVLEQRRPKSIRIATLLDKPDRRIQPVKIDYIGFQIPDEFVVGYGLDYAEDYRNLADICVLSE
jgi:hypoxanthine phosphoribosyltransferase